MVLRIVDAEVRGPQCLWLSFNDGTHGKVNPRFRFRCAVFEPLQDADYFAKAEVDRVSATRFEKG